MNSLRNDVDTLTKYIAALEQQRSLNPFANDVYEGAWYWRSLGNWVLESDTRTDFPARAREELSLIETLRKLLLKRSRDEQAQYMPVFETAERILRTVETVQPPMEGHLGVLRIISEQFGFLETNFGFAIVDRRPIGARFSSGSVFLDLQWARKYNSSCSFGQESNPKQSFWIDDLLFMYGDERYRVLPQELDLNTESAVEKWFKFLADIFHQYGHAVLSNEPGVFERLGKAQAKRDQEYIDEMDRLYGNR